MLLSIGMIVKNEEASLRKCLECLKPILEQVDSELIIADTGSTDGTLDIAREYADKVLQIEWRGDFAWARNKTLERARGKWFMYVDADEFFQDPSELIKFFNSGEYKKYRCASHLREEVTGNMLINSVSQPSRLFKIDKDTMFRGTIHEYIQMYMPHKVINTISLHEGYKYTGTMGKKKKREKHERNLIPLLVLHDENPNDKRTLGHIINEYFGSDELLPKAKEFIDTGLALYQDGQPHDKFYHYFRHRLINYYINSNERKEALDSINDYFETTKELYANAIDIKILKAQLLIKLERFDEVPEALQQALEYYEMHERGELDSSSIMGILAIVGTSPKTKDFLIGEISKAYSRIGDFSEARQWADKSEKGNIDIYEPYVGLIIKDGSPEEVVKLYNYLTDNFETDSEEYEKGIVAIDRHITETDTRREIAKALLNENNVKNNGEDYLKLQLMRKLYDNGGELKEAAEYFLKSEKCFSQLYGDVIAAAIKIGADYTPFLEKMKIIDTSAMINGIVKTNTMLGETFPEYIKNTGWLEKPQSILSVRVTGLLSYVILRNNLKAEVPVISACFETYARTFDRFLSMMYKDDVYSEDMIDSLQEQARFVFYANNAYKRKDSGDILGFISGLRSAVKADPSLSDAISSIIDSLKEEEEEAASKAAAIRDDLNKETAALKDVIYALIYGKDFKMARHILTSYEQINPNDPDIITIKDMIAKAAQ